MKYFFVLLLTVSLFFAGCSAHRAKGEPYKGYSCRESLIHYFSECSDEKLTKEKFEEELKNCENKLSSGICDQEQVDLLWCMGNVVADKGNKIKVHCSYGVCKGKEKYYDGCSCDTYVSNLKKCRLNLGIFDK